MEKRRLVVLFILNIIINLFIFSKLKIFFYNLLPGFKIDYGCRLGQMSFLIVKRCSMSKGSIIGSFTIVMDTFNFSIGNNSIIGRKTILKGLNTFYMGNNSFVGIETRGISRHIDRKILMIKGGGRFIIGNNTHITAKHYFDLAGSILIKNNVVIGGLNTKLFTHGFDCFGNFAYGNIIINSMVYIGTDALLLPGIKINSEINVGAGAVVSKSLNTRGSYAGNPIRKLSDDPKMKCIIIKK